MTMISTCATERNELTHLSYSTSGELLASQSNSPAFEVTIWNWQSASIILQFKSAQLGANFDLKFSTENHRYMYTAGAKHLQFWDIVRTFTGLKLLHDTGRFGKFISCDILTVCPESRNRLLTNCEWGNVLVWENARIKFEVCRKNRQPLHTALITQISLYHDYLYTIAMDSFVRVWFWDTIAMAEMHEHEKIIEFEAVYEYEITLSIRSRDDLLSFTLDPENTRFCYIHDGSGVIWKSDIDVDFTSHRLEAIFRASSKDLVSLTMSPNANQLITLDAKGVMCLYNYRTKPTKASSAMIFQHRFPVASHCVVWCCKAVCLLFKLN